MSKRADSSHRTSLRAFLDILVFIQLCHGQDECEAYVSPDAVAEEGTVCGAQDNPCPSIVDSISVLDNANKTGCTLKLLPGTYTGGSNLNITNDSPAWLRIEGVEGYAKTILDCEYYYESYAFKILPLATEVIMDYFISDITIKRCNGSEDAIYGGHGSLTCAGHNLVVTDCEFYNNTQIAEYWNAGGAIKVTSSDYVQVSRCYFEGNSASWGGGVFSFDVDDLLIEDVIFYQNRSPKFPAALNVENCLLLTMRNVRLSEHHGIGPSVINVWAVKDIVWTDVIVENSIVDPTLTWSYNCISLMDPNTDYESSVYWNNVQVINVDGGHEGVTIFGWYRDIQIVNCLFENSLGAKKGAALRFFSSASSDLPWNIRIEDTRFINSFSRIGYAGVIDLKQDETVEGTLLIKGCTFSDSYTFEYGGVIVISATAMIVDIIDSKFINSIAEGGEGGAIYIAEVLDGYTHLNIQNSEFVNNSAVEGGSIFYNAIGSASIDSTTFTDGHAVTKGGSYSGVELATFANIDFIRCSADEFGGAIYSHNGYLDVVECDFVNCSAAFGGAFYIGPRSTLVGDNLVFDSCHAVGDAKCGGAAGYGGSVYFAEDSCNNSTLSDASFTDNIADTTGAVFFLEEDDDCDLCDKDCEYENNFAAYGIEIGTRFFEVRIRDDPSSVLVTPGKKFVLQLKALDLRGNKLAGNHVDIKVTADSEEAESRGVIIEGQNLALFKNGSAELSMTIFVREDFESTSTLDFTPTVWLHLDLTPTVERLTVQLEIGECGEFKKLVPNSEKATGDVQLFTCGDIVEPVLGNQIGAWVVATLLLIVLIVNAILLIYYKNYSQIMNGNKRGLFLINIGLILMQIGALFAASSELCAATVWFTLFGFSMASAFLIVKNAQLAILHHFVYDKGILGVTKILESWVMLAGAAFLMVIDFIILIVWTAIDSPFYILSEYQRTCVSDKTQTYAIALVVFKLLEMIGCFVIVYKLNSVPQMFREVAATLLVIPAILLLFGIVTWSSDLIVPSAAPILNSYIISIFVLFMYLIIFVEKWYLLHEGRYQVIGKTSQKIASSTASSVESRSYREELLGDLKSLEREFDKTNKNLMKISQNHKSTKEQFFYGQLFGDFEKSRSSRAGNEKDRGSGDDSKVTYNV